MDKDSTYKNHLIDFLQLLREDALSARTEYKNTPEEKIAERKYNEGVLFGYYLAFSLLLDQMDAFEINREELGIAEFNPDRELLAQHQPE